MLKKEFIKTVILIIFSALCIFMGIQQIKPPSSKNWTKCSTDRLFNHLNAIALETHPIGSPENIQVKQYIISTLQSYGLTPEIQTSTVVSSGHTWNSFGKVENIIVKIKGIDSSESVAVVSHYDSVFTGPGASDDAAAVSCMIEAAGYFSKTGPYKHDILLIFTDGEEMGLYGAEAFVKEHPSAEDVKIILNFEARGVEGASLMFETGENNGKMIEAFSQAAIKPIAFSWAYDVYTRMPNNTDFTVFKDKNIQGMNFAFIEKGFTHYHRAIDNLDNINSASLTHHFMHMVELAEYFANSDMNVINDQNRVFFSIMGSLFSYRYSFTPLLMGLSVLLFIAAVTINRKDIKWLKVLKSGAAFFLFTIITIGSVYFLWKAVRIVHSDYYSVFWNSGYNAIFYFFAFFFLITLFFSVTINVVKKWSDSLNFMICFSIIMLLPLIYTSWVMKGSSYLFVFPFIFLNINLIINNKIKSNMLSLTINYLLSIPIFLIYIPACYLVNEALGLNMYYLSTAVLLIILLGFVSPIMIQKDHFENKALSVILTLGFLILMIVGTLTSEFTAEHPKPDTLCLYIDKMGHSHWITGTQSPESWSSEITGKGTETQLDSAYYKKTVSASPAGPLKIDPLKIEHISHTISENSLQLITFKITRTLSQTWARLKTDGRHIKSASINDNNLIIKDNKLALICDNVPEEGVILTLEAEQSDIPLIFNTLTIESKPGLNKITLPQRPNYLYKGYDRVEIEQEFRF